MLDSIPNFEDLEIAKLLLPLAHILRKEGSDKKLRSWIRGVAKKTFPPIFLSQELGQREDFPYSQRLRIEKQPVREACFLPGSPGQFPGW